MLIQSLSEFPSKDRLLHASFEAAFEEDGELSFRHGPFSCRHSNLWQLGSNLAQLQASGFLPEVWVPDPRTQRLRRLGTALPSRPTPHTGKNEVHSIPRSCRRILFRKVRTPVCSTAAGAPGWRSGGARQRTRCDPSPCPRDRWSGTGCAKAQETNL
jgi:hypothetical protein